MLRIPPVKVSFFCVFAQVALVDDDQNNVLAAANDGYV
jgi:hypothetical protein